jgi:predicted aconitase with swiveling domain
VNTSGREGKQALMWGRALVPGMARGEALVLREPLSFWGGMDPQTGRLVDPHHPQLGADLGGRVLLMPSGRGSSSSSSVLAEAVRLGTAPAAVVLLAPDPIVALGAVVAAELYGRDVPVLVLEPTAYGSIRSGDLLEIRVDGKEAVLSVVTSG